MKQTGFWRALERLASGAVMAEWTRELDGELERARQYLLLAPALAESHPCVNALGCGLPHRVEELKPGVWEAVCGPEEGCPSFRLENKDLMVFSVESGGLCRGIAGALGLGSPPGGKLARVRAEAVGTYGPARSAVYLMFPGEGSRTMREVERLFCAEPDPFVLLTPTGVHCTADVESALRRQACMHIALSEAMVLGANGSLAASTAAAGLLGEFTRRLGEGRGLVKTVERMDRNIEAVAKGSFELRRENEELRTLQKEGFFKFALKVDGEDFRAFAIIMALGTRKAAADFLKVPHRSFYDQVEKWTGRGKDYQRLHRFVEWRKKVGRKIMVPLGDSMQSGEPGDKAENPETVEAVADKIAGAESRDYPSILREILEVLSEQNPKNWAEVRGELIELIRGEVG